MSNIEQPYKTCVLCKYWDRDNLVTRAPGYVEAICLQPEDDRDKKYKRGSDKCSHWMTKN